MWDQGPADPQVTPQPAQQTTQTGGVGEHAVEDAAPQTATTQFTASGDLPPVAPTATTSSASPTASEMAFGPSDSKDRKEQKLDDKVKEHEQTGASVAGATAVDGTVDAGVGGAATAAAAPAAKPKTLGEILKKNGTTIDQLKAGGWALTSIANELLQAKGIDSPTQSQTDNTSYELSEAIKKPGWESFEAPVSGNQLLKTEDNVNQRLGNIFFEKQVFSDDELKSDNLKLDAREQKTLQGGYESGVSGMVMAASFINTSHRSEGDFSHAYGDEAWDGYLKAEAFLNNIPKGQFLDQLNVELMRHVNELIFAPDVGMKAKMLRTIAMIGRGGRWDKGGEIREGRQYARPEHYSGDEIKNLTEAGVHVNQLTHKEDGGGMAGLEYPKPEMVVPTLEKLVKDLKEQTTGPNADPIGAAASFQRHFVALHPFGDSNGRTSRILMNRILQEFDFGPAILSDQNRDISLSADEWRTEVAKGCARSKKFLGSSWGEKHVESKDEYASKLGITTQESPDKPVIIGGKPFDLGADGLLYDPTGRPYMVEDDELVPMAQLEHFVMSRRVASAGALDAPDLLKHTTEQTRALYDKVAANPDAGKDIKVKSDARARKADEQYKLSPDPAVGKMLTDLTDVGAMKDPQSMFKIQGGAGHGTSISATLSKYAQVDLEFWYVERGLRDTKQNDLVDKIREHRAKLFELAKAEVDKGKDATRVSKDNPEGFHFKYEKMMYDTSPLRFASFAEAQHELGDNTMTVWRGDYSFSRLVGMAPNNDIRQPDAKDIADERAGKGQLTNLYDDLVKLEGSAVGRQYICTTSDLALLTGNFADSTKSQTVNLGSMPVFVRGKILQWLDPAQAEGAPRPDKAALEAKRKTAVDRGDSIVPGEVGYDGKQGKEIKDTLGIPGTILTLKVVDREAGKIEVAAARKAFQIELDKEALLPGIYALGGPSFESEQEIHGLSKVRPWDIKSAHKAEELREEFPVSGKPEEKKDDPQQPAPGGAGASHV